MISINFFTYYFLISEQFVASDDSNLKNKYSCQVQARSRENIILDPYRHTWPRCSCLIRQITHFNDNYDRFLAGSSEAVFLPCVLDDGCRRFTQTLDIICKDVNNRFLDINTHKLPLYDTTLHRTSILIQFYSTTTTTRSSSSGGSSCCSISYRSDVYTFVTCYNYVLLQGKTSRNNQNS